MLPAGQSVYLEELNPAQREAAAWGVTGNDGASSAGPLLIIAGAGSGKTMTLAYRVAHLVLRGVAPERILLLTFTRRAAECMLRRAESVVSRALAAGGGQRRPAPLPWAGTYHSVANRLLRRYADNLAIDPQFSILDRSDAADVMDAARQELKLSERGRRFPKKDTCVAIYSRVVNTRRPLEAVLSDHYPWCGEWHDDLRELFRRYVEKKQQNRALDYDDLLLYWRHLVDEPDFARHIGALFDHVLVDEYQDTNVIQAEILLALKPDGRGVTVVGDDAQSIYSFRAAEIDNILHFPKQFRPEATVVTLEQNYRSTGAILATANRLLAEGGPQYPKRLFSVKPEGEKPALVTVEDQDAEAEYVVDAILERRESGVPLRDQAVLFRSAHHSDRLELELVRRNIPYVKYGGLKFLEAAHVKDLLCILKWAENPRNEIAAIRVLKLLPGIGPRHAARCLERLRTENYRLEALAAVPPPQAAARHWTRFADLMIALSASPARDDWRSGLGRAVAWYRPELERLYDGFEARSADLEQLEAIAARYPTRERFLSELTLDPPAASGDFAGDPLLDEDYLVLSTVHSAKGQEWNTVYVLNVTDGNFPSEFATGDAKAIEEERRLLYVAVTRARFGLTLVAPFRFFVTQQSPEGSRYVHGTRSRFLTEGVLATLRQAAHVRDVPSAAADHARPARTIDVAGRMRDMW